jgi:branched-chain amino acid transport system substrate-binding protein
MKQATSLLPGTRIKTSPINHSPLQQLQMMRLKSERWELLGPMPSSE